MTVLFFSGITSYRRVSFEEETIFNFWQNQKTQSKLSFPIFLHFSSWGIFAIFLKSEHFIGLINRFQVYILKCQAIFPDLLSNRGQIGHRTFFIFLFFRPDPGNEFPPNWCDLMAKSTPLIHFWGLSKRSTFKDPTLRKYIIDAKHVYCVLHNPTCFLMLAKVGPFINMSNKSKIYVDGGKILFPLSLVRE